MFVFVLVMGDITASAILAGTNTPVVGVTMLSLFQNGTYTQLAVPAAVVTLLSMIVVIATLLLVNPQPAAPDAMAEGRRRRAVREAAVLSARAVDVVHLW